MKYQSGLWPSNLDISIRDEVITVLDGTSSEFSRGRWLIFRRILRDSNDKPINCMQCKKKGYHAAQANQVCDRCFGVGYLWEESWIKVFQWSGVQGGSRKSGDRELVDAGNLDYNTNVFYVKYNVFPRPGDKIIEVHTDGEGNTIQPYVRRFSWNITSVVEHYLDGGRIEYFRVLANRESSKYFGQPLNQLIPADGDIY